MQGPAEARMIWEHRCTPTRLGLAFRSTLDEYPEGMALAIIYLSLLPTTQLAACSEFPRRPFLGYSVNRSPVLELIEVLASVCTGEFISPASIRVAATR